MRPDEEGFLQPAVDAAKCVKCGKCEAVCPVLHHGKPRKPLAVYAAKAKDDELRWGSASGGVFTILAQETLRRGGVVFGAGFERPTWRVIHKVATDLDELDDLRGSKYVQSDTGDTFKEAKMYLEAGREVLYSGCPCQIAALKNFLGRDYPNLRTVDLICHGVPSPLAWRKYLDCREEAQGKTTRVFARRYCAWQDQSLVIHSSKGVQYQAKAVEDLYMISYARHWTLRNACYDCAFRGLASGADLTIGDAWSRWPSATLKDRQYGLSFVVLAAFGKLAIKDVLARDVNLEPVSYKRECMVNWPLITKPRKPRLRGKFFSLLNGCRFDEAVARALQMRDRSLVIHFAWWIKRLIANGELNKF